ncbi:MAG TPA: hypothetical protein PK971_16780, partial [Saprospiraceae bacterium]|nr:hypothetical protein [Saprospiraceae bacterium]
KSGPTLKCNDLTVANLSPAGLVTLQAADLKVSAQDGCSDPAQVTLKLTGQNSVTYICNDLGIKVISVTATDASGNSSTCLHNVLVRDPANYCIGGSSGCNTGCPPSAVVTYEHGYEVLLPAFQANDWSVFDPYGAPTFDASCTPSDTIYEVTYNPPSLGQTWFTREWNLSLNGVLFGKCKQWVVFPAWRALNFEGHVFVDTLINCTYETGEPGVNIFKVSATRLPSNERVEASVASDGAYALSLESDQTDTLIVVRLELPSGLHTACSTVYPIHPDTAQPSYTLDFGLTSEVQCPLNQVSIGNNLLRRCFDNNYFHVQYCNMGFQPAEDAYITVELDSLLIVQEASLPFTQNGQVLNFQLGDLPPFTCDKFWVRVKVSCDAQ